MSICMSLFDFVCVYIRLSMCRYLSFVRLYLSFCVSVSVTLFLCVCLYMSVCIRTSVSGIVCLSVIRFRVHVILSIQLFVSLPFSLCISLSISRSVCESVCVFARSPKGDACRYEDACIDLRGLCIQVYLISG